MFVVPLLSSVTKLLGTTALDEAGDRLSCTITAVFYILGALLISARANVGTAIECWLPQTYSKQWEDFAENYCFLKDTYWYPNSQPMDHVSDVHKSAHRLSYYQWSGMYLAVFGIFFMLPKFIWRSAQSPMDMNILYFCNTAKTIRDYEASERKAKVTEMAEFLRNKLFAQHSLYSMAAVPMYSVYMLVKLLYVLIAFAQFIVLSLFIGKGFDILWGWDLFMNLTHGITWEQTGLFPRVTFCDFTIREVAGNLRDETIQCVIGINEFNEKIFLFLWFWLVFLIFAVSFCTLFTIHTLSKDHFVSSMLEKIRDPSDVTQEKMFLKFSVEHLGMNGKIVLSFVKSQSDIVAQELAVAMYKNYEKRLENGTNGSASPDEKGSYHMNFDKAPLFPIKNGNSLP